MLESISVSLIVEITLAVLLALTLMCCARLELRLKNLRKDQETLGGTVRALNGAITAAQTSLAGLRAAAKEADENLGRRVTAARAVADELSLLTSSGERIAKRIESAHAAAPKSVPSPAPAFPEKFRAVR
jgi:Flp pilus assembly protein TadB